jgi:hypothetical protein
LEGCVVDSLYIIPVAVSDFFDMGNSDEIDQLRERSTGFIVEAGFPFDKQTINGRFQWIPPGGAAGSVKRQSVSEPAFNQAIVT